MIQTVEQSSVPREIEYPHVGVKAQTVLSELVIPAVPGEFYSYPSAFTEECPLYALMKCKANKNRPIATVAELGKEANLVFLFDNLIKVCSVKTANVSSLLDGKIHQYELFVETWIALAGITAEDFHKLCLRKDVKTLVEVCQSACLKHQPIITMEPGAMIAMMTDEGKYGMFLVERLTPTSIEIDACHILL